MSRFTKLLKAKYPILQAPMAGVTTPSFVSAVSNSGGIGSHGVAMLSPDIILKDIKEIKNTIKNDFPFCVNLFVLPKSPNVNKNNQNNMNNILDKFYNELNISMNKFDKYGEYFNDQFDIILSEGVPIFSFTFGALTKEQILLLKKKDIIVLGTATNTTEGQYLFDIGCNGIIAQGSEAGGHRGTFIGSFNHSMIGTMTLIPSIIDKIDNKIPVIGAGGIMDGRGLNAVKMLGGCGVQMGTVFLNTLECQIANCYKQILRNKEWNIDTNSCVTDKFSGRPARGLKNKFIKQMNDYIMNNSNVIIPKYPIMNKLTQQLRNEAKKQNNVDYMSLWAGQGVNIINNYEYNITVNQLIQNIVNQSELLLNA